MNMDGSQMIADQRPRAHLQEFNALRSQNVTSRGFGAIRELMCVFR